MNKKTLKQYFPPATEEDWQKAAQKLLKGRPIEKTLFTETDEGITLKPIYHNLINPEIPAPGAFPFTRGFISQADGNKWHIAQTLFADNKSFNSVAREVLENGQTALNINLDLVSQFADHAAHIPEVLGTVHLTNFELLEQLLLDIDLNKIPLYFDALNTTPKIFLWLQKLCHKKGFDFSKVDCSLGADPISAALKYGGFPNDFSSIMQDIGQLFTEHDKPRNMTFFTIYADQIHNAGGTKINELSYALATTAHYINVLQEIGIQATETVNRIRVKLAIAPDQFTEIAKIRAIRILWANLCRAYDIPDHAIDLKIDAVTSWRTMSLFDPWTNMLRATSEGFSAIIAGCNSLDILPFDLPLGTPDSFSLRQARNIQIILAEECHFNKITDPAGGSAFIESLTHEIAEKSWQKFQKIEDNGGIYAQVLKGTFQDEISINATRGEDQYNTSHKKAIGTNIYPNLSEKKPVKNKHIVKTTQLTAQLKKPVKALKMNRVLNKVEYMRQYIENQEKKPKILLALFGEPADYNLQARFIREYFEVIAIKVDEEIMPFEISEAIQKIIIANPDAAVICAKDNKYPEFVVHLSKKIKQKNSRIKFFMTGIISDQETYLKAGIDGFVHLGSDLWHTMHKIIELNEVDDV